MTINAHEAMEQAFMTASLYAGEAIANLCRHLDIDRHDPDWRKQLAPFAAVLAAMITAAAQDFDTACHDGAVVGTVANKKAR